MNGKTTFTILLLATLAVAVAFAFGPAGAQKARGQNGGAKYIGPQACAMCHADAYKSYQEMKHSKAFSALNAKEIADGKIKDGRRCIQCHTTGYKKGGFVSADKTPKLENVTCEACHGPGSVHMKTMMNAKMNGVDVTKMKDKKITLRGDCTQCHNPHINYGKVYGGK